jgi:uncharacterized protein YggE
MMPWLLPLTMGLSLLAQQTPPRSSIPHIRVHGDATVSARPDRVQLDVGVIGQGASSQAATELNARQSNAVIDQLRKLVPSANIRTVNFSVNANYQYPKDGSPATIAGYTANNTVRVELDDLAALPGIIDAATGSGANNVNRVTFGLRDERGARAEALGRAVDQARASARALAMKMNVRLGRLLSIEEEQPLVVSPGRQVELAPRAKSGGGESTPVEPGMIDVHASVQLTIAVIQ